MSTTKKTLGGDRVGAGKRMTVEMHGYGRSNHDIGYLWRSSMSAGTVVPFFNEIGLPGDTFDIDLDVHVLTHPTVGPLFGSYKVQLDMYQTPLRLYNSLMYFNMLKIGMDMSVVKLPQIKLKALPYEDGTTDYDNAQINPSSILAYLGIRGIGSTTTEQERLFNATSLLVYWDTVKNYYANKQEKIGAVIHVNTEEVNQTITDFYFKNPGATEPGYPIPVSPSVGTSPLMLAGAIFRMYFTGTAPNPSTVIVNVASGGVIEQVPATLLVSGWTNNTTYLFGEMSVEWAGYTIVNYEYINPSTPVNGKPTVETFDLDNIDQMRKNILAWQSETTPFTIDDTFDAPYGWLPEQPFGIPNILSSQEGLAVKTYQSDLYNNWLDTTFVNYINSTSAVSTAGGSFAINALILANKIFNYLNRVVISGASYDDWQDAVWAHDRAKQPMNPIYEGGLIRELVFQEVISNSESDNQPLGTLAGKGTMSNKKKGGKIVIKIDEPSIVMGLISLTPRIDYSQGNSWDVNLETMDDLMKPELNGIGFEDSINERRAWWSTKYSGGNWVQTSAGKVPAWINYMTNVNKTYGNFAIPDNEMFMTLNRRYERASNNDIEDLTTYIDPSKFNFIFAQTSLDSQNFWVQIAVDAEKRSKVAAKQIPNL